METLPTTTAEIGAYGEEKAVQYLRGEGYQILDRNYANTRGTRLGEIDIVAEKSRNIVFVEVKSALIGPDEVERLPEWKISPAKLRKMEKAALLYLREKQLDDRDYSFDAVTVVFAPDHDPAIRHLEHIFYT